MKTNQFCPVFSEVKPYKGKKPSLIETISLIWHHARKFDGVLMTFLYRREFADVVARDGPPGGGPRLRSRQSLRLENDPADPSSGGGPG